MTHVIDSTGVNSPKEKEKDLTVQVRYIAVKQPAVQRLAPSVTLAALKQLALDRFELQEGAVDGGTKTYNLIFSNKTLTDLTVTLGSFGEHELKFTLVEQLIQG